MAEGLTRHPEGRRVCFDSAGLMEVMVLDRLSDPFSELGVMR